MAAAARMEWSGVPIDTETLHGLQGNWERIKSRLIREINKDYGVFVPTGQRIINPDSRLGAVIFQEAEANDLDPYRLADAIDFVWREEREANAELFAARRAARQATGLTPARINQWEDAGHDSSNWPGLDVKARELSITPGPGRRGEVCGGRRSVRISRLAGAMATTG
jgi:hypothetical protein